TGNKFPHILWLILGVAQKLQVAPLTHGYNIFGITDQYLLRFLSHIGKRKKWKRLDEMTSFPELEMRISRAKPKSMLHTVWV
ncbi:hypothetical protein ACJX0J_023210, partial [Zea mays]